MEFQEFHRQELTLLSEIPNTEFPLEIPANTPRYEFNIK